MTDNPLLFFDIEATGPKPETDRIVTLFARKLMPPAFKLDFDLKCNPGVVMPDEVIDIHGITNEEVKDCPPFSHFAERLHQFFSGCDLVGFNHSNYDVPLLWEEFNRCGIDWEPGLIIDVGTIFKRKEPRDLSSAVRHYCWREHNGAHSAENDVLATLEVYQAQMAQYTDLPKDRKELALYSQYDEKRVDLAGKIILDHENQPVYNFGNSKGKPVMQDAGFGRWMLGKDFSENTKQVVRDILYGKREQKEMRF